MKDVQAESEEVHSENSEPLNLQGPTHDQPKLRRSAGNRDLLSLRVPTTPNQTPTLSNDVPIGPVSSKKLIKGLQDIQQNTEGDFVVQSRFGTPIEQDGIIFTCGPNLPCITGLK